MPTRHESARPGDPAEAVALKDLHALRHWAKIPSCLDDHTNEGCELWAKVFGNVMDEKRGLMVRLSHQERPDTVEHCLICVDEIPDLINYLERVYKTERALPREILLESKEPEAWRPSDVSPPA